MKLKGIVENIVKYLNEYYNSLDVYGVIYKVEYNLKTHNVKLEQVEDPHFNIYNSQKELIATSNFNLPEYQEILTNWPKSLVYNLPDLPANEEEIIKKDQFISYLVSKL